MKTSALRRWLREERAHEFTVRKFGMWTLDRRVPDELFTAMSVVPSIIRQPQPEDFLEELRRHQVRVSWPMLHVPSQRFIIPAV